MTARVVARGLSRRYAGALRVRDVDLDLEPAEVVGLIGPNGGGKSTLLLLLAGLVRPTGGTVELDGVPTSDLAVRSTGAIGLITAEPGLYPLLTGRENLHYFGGLHGLSGAEVDRRASPLLDELEVDQDLERRSATYSSGMRQKVSLARALLLSPALLLLDEPTSNLDPISSHTVHRAVRRHADGGTAVVLATHDLHAAEHICDRVLVMRETIRAERRLSGARELPDPSGLFRLYTESLP